MGIGIGIAVGVGAVVVAIAVGAAFYFHVRIKRQREAKQQRQLASSLSSSAEEEGGSGGEGGGPQNALSEGSLAAAAAAAAAVVWKASKGSVIGSDASHQSLPATSSDEGRSPKHQEHMIPTASSDEGLSPHPRQGYLIPTENSDEGRSLLQQAQQQVEGLIPTSGIVQDVDAAYVCHAHVLQQQQQELIEATNVTATDDAVQQQHQGDGHMLSTFVVANDAHSSPPQPQQQLRQLQQSQQQQRHLVSTFVVAEDAEGPFKSASSSDHGGSSLSRNPAAATAGSTVAWGIGCPTPADTLVPKESNSVPLVGSSGFPAEAEAADVCMWANPTGLESRSRGRGTAAAPTIESAVAGAAARADNEGAVGQNGTGDVAPVPVLPLPNSAPLSITTTTAALDPARSWRSRWRAPLPSSGSSAWVLSAHADAPPSAGSGGSGRSSHSSVTIVMKEAE